ncbi:MAG TPA: UDP-3-O-acyl-N-acetylglucosamine deacetylase [Stellaceae bacterium]|nr:UDP-3-O-acyl-N-acetylglucosamine deacetylase [Stellaceae bacterium]
MQYRGFVLEFRGSTAHQKTLKAAIHCRGVGLHSGARINMTLHPAAPGTGITFCRRDLGGAEVVADWRNIVDSTLCTTIGAKNGTKVATIEHLMAAFAGLEIDNARVELDGPEVPVMDGSAAPFVFLIECAGVAEQVAPRRGIKVLKPIRVGDGESAASLAPADNFRISFAIDFASSAIRCQELSYAVNADSFKADISRARTFGFLDDVERMRRAGLARGGSLENAVVISGDRVLNKEGLRYDDEFVRHKALDALGDLYLAGGTILGEFHGVRSGHALNHQLLKALFADPAAWRPVTLAAVQPSWDEEPQRARA